MDDERDPKTAERSEEQPEDLDVAKDDAEAVKGGDTFSKLIQQQHEMKKGIVQNFRV
jgi:hypothetical protein